jgi:cysteinyl-tRNA synthetase
MKPEGQAMMVLRLYDTYTRSLRDFQPLHAQAVQQRQQARAARQWPLADQLRTRISAAGYEVEDTPQGPQVHHARPKELA